jgi:mono/diheme cytochrome c family protein
MQMRIMLTALTLAGLSATAVSAADAKAGQAVYDKSCKACHGPDGTANASVAKMMKALSDDDIKKIVTDGKGKMKPVKAVSGVALDNVVAYIRTLK